MKLNSYYDDTQIKTYGIYLESNDEREASSAEEVYELFEDKVNRAKEDWYVEEIDNHNQNYGKVSSGDYLMAPDSNDIIIDFHDLHIEDINWFPIFLSISDIGGRFHIDRVIKDKNNVIQKLIYKGTLKGEDTWTATIYNVDYSVDMNKDDIGFTGHGN